jgi:hypothetical protein
MTLESGTGAFDSLLARIEIAKDGLHQLKRSSVARIRHRQFVAGCEGFTRIVPFPLFEDRPPLLPRPVRW